MKVEFTLPDGTEEERAIYLQFAKKFGLKITSEPKEIERIHGKHKLIKEIRFCSLCETESLQCVVMSKYTDGTWKVDQQATENEEIRVFSEISTHERKVDCCNNCMGFLMSKEKKELAKMLMRSRSVALINLAVKRTLKEMRGENDE